MQAEHIPVHLGAMPAAVRRDPRRGARARALMDPQRPVPRRHPPARHHGDHPGVRRRRADRVRRQPRSPRRCRRPDPGIDAGRQPHARGRGRRDRAAACSTTLRSTALAAQMRQPAQRRADLRAQLAAGAVGVRRLGELHDRVGGDTLREAFTAVLDYAERRTRACIEELDDGDVHRRGRARGTRGRSADRAARDRRRRHADARLRGDRRPSTRGISTARSPSPTRPATSPFAS